jgi:hypothetical protein
MREKAFPLIIIALSVCAGIIYLLAGNVRKGLFWLFAAGVNICATF